MKISMRSLFLLTLALCACGKNNVQIDTSSLPATTAQNPVALVEAKDTNPPVGFGMEIGENFQDNNYCTAFVMNSGDIQVHSSCLYDGNKELISTNKLQVYLHRPDLPGTSAYSVKSILEIHTDADNSWAVLEPDSKEEILSTYGSLSSADTEAPSTEELMNNNNLPAITIAAPDHDGVAKLFVTSVALSLDNRDPQPSSSAPNNSKPRRTRPRGYPNSMEYGGIGVNTVLRPSPSPSPTPNPTAVAAAAPSALSLDAQKKDLLQRISHHSRLRLVQKEEASSTGAIVIYNGHVLAISNHKGEAQWWGECKSATASPSPAPATTTP